MNSKRQKLEEIFFTHASPEERLAYEKKRAEKKAEILKSMPAEVIQGKEGKPGKPGSPDTPKQIIDKINSLTDEPENQIDFKHIKNFPWKAIGEGIKRSGTVHPLVNWGSDLNTFETPNGIIDGTNVTFTVVHKPKAIILNQGIYFENDGYTLSDYTITMLITPVLGSVLRSMY